MSTVLGRITRAVSATAILVAALPAVANADPAGCGGSGAAGINGNGYMTGTGEAGCNGVATRTYVIEIKQDISGQPDPKVAGNSQQAYTNSYYVQVSSCDHGKTATYYGRGYFTTNTTYHDGAHQHWHVC